jgi:hypothetical protein
MYKWLPALMVGLLLASMPRGRADDNDVRALIEKAVVAHGGEANLAKLQMVRVKSKGTLKITGMTIAFTSDLLYQLPGKSKNKLTLKLPDEKLAVVQVLNGNKAWETVAGETKNIEGDELQALREDCYSNNVESLVPLLKEKAFTLSMIDGANVNGKPAAGVKVQAKDHKDIDLYFDKETDLLVRVVRKAYDAESMKERTFETVYSNFKDFNGVKQPAKARLSKDGMKFADVEVTDLKVLDKVDPNEFNKSF